MSIKQEQQIYQELCGFVSKILTGNGWSKWANNVLQYGQWTLQEVPSPSVMIDYNDGAKYGWESTKYKWDSKEQSGKAEISYYRQIYVDFLFFRNPKDMIVERSFQDYDSSKSNYGVDKDGNLVVSNRYIWKGSENGMNGVSVGQEEADIDLAPDYMVSAIDVAQYVRTYILSDFGIEELRGMGYGIIDSSEMENSDIETDDSIYARTPRFSLTLVTKETTFVDVDFVEDYKVKMYGV